MGPYDNDINDSKYFFDRKNDLIFSVGYLEGFRYDRVDVISMLV